MLIDNVSRTILAAIFIVLFVVGFLVNLFILITAIWKHKELVAVDILACHLVVLDMIMVAVPCTRMAHALLHGGYKHMSIMCIIDGVISYHVGMASTFTQVRLKLHFGYVYSLQNLSTDQQVVAKPNVFFFFLI